MMNRIATRTAIRTVRAKAATRAYAVPPAPGVEPGSTAHAAQQAGTEALRAKVAGNSPLAAGVNAGVNAGRGIPPPQSSNTLLYAGIGLAVAGGLYYAFSDPATGAKANANLHDAEGRAKVMANEAEGKARGLANQAEGKMDELAGKAKGKWEEAKGEAKKAMK